MRSEGGGIGSLIFSVTVNIDVVEDIVVEVELVEFSFTDRDSALLEILDVLSG